VTPKQPEQMKKVTLVLLLSITSFLIEAQTDSTKNNSLYKKRELPQEDRPARWWDKCFAGGNVSFSFASARGGQNFYLYGSPMLGYHVTKNFNLAAGPLLAYYQNNYNNVSVSSYVYGPRFFMQHRVYGIYHLHAEIEGMNILSKAKYSNLGGEQRTWISTPMVGLALVNESGGRAFYSLTILYNTTWDTNKDISPYGPLVIRAGIFFNLGDYQPD
jgi:hypothetical protein